MFGGYSWETCSLFLKGNKGGKEREEVEWEGLEGLEEEENCG